MKTYKEAIKECQKIGASHARGEALAAMYANLVSGIHGGSQETYYKHLSGLSDSEITQSARTLLRDRSKAWDVLIA